MIFLQEQVVSTGLSWLDKAKDMAFEYAPKLLAAILIYIIGSWLIGLVSRGLGKMLAKRNYDKSLQSFLVSVVRAVLLVLLFLTIFSQLGVNITSFAALLAGAGLAIGAALNGSLGNLAGGVMIMIFKPFKVGDYIEAQSVQGQVQEIGIFNTTVLSPENKTIYLPNGALSTGTITNNTAAGYLRVDTVMAIAPSQDIEKARQTAIAALKQLPNVLDTPAPEVSVLKVADGMVSLAIRPYAKQPDYWDVFFGAQEAVKNAWDAAGVEGPTPTRLIINK